MKRSFVMGPGPIVRGRRDSEMLLVALIGAPLVVVVLLTIIAMVEQTQIVRQ